MAEKTSKKSDATMSKTFPQPSIHSLPSTIISTILSKLDVRSICSAAATCSSLRHCASHTFSFIPTFHIIDIAPSLELLRPLMPPNSFLKSLKLDCARLDDSSIEHLVRPSLDEVCLHNCANLSGKLLAMLGERCGDLRY